MGFALRAVVTLLPDIRLVTGMIGSGGRQIWSQMPKTRPTSSRRAGGPIPRAILRGGLELLCRRAEYRSANLSGRGLQLLSLRRPWAPFWRALPRADRQSLREVFSWLHVWSKHSA